MTIRDLITQEAADLRAKATQLRTDANGEALQFEAKAKSMEGTLASLPAEIEALTEDAAEKVWQWVKSL